MKVIIAPDKFKGSITSLDACRAIQEGILRAGNTIELLLFPMADGGDGFAEVMKYYTDTISVAIGSFDPLGRPISSTYELNPSREIAIIELATCSGLAMLELKERNPLLTSTYGTGVQIRDAIEKGAEKIILGLGGSATNDGGIGIINAMGFQFVDKDGHSLKPIGQSLSQIVKIIPPRELPVVQFEIACDVTNPLFGPEGAAFIFSPQKGADARQVELLDNGLRNLANVIEAQTGKKVAAIPGSGAAGGIAAGLMAFFPVTMMKGTEVVVEASNLKNCVPQADVIITGEGKLDKQSFHGKTVSAISYLGKEYNIPVVALCGKVDLTDSEYGHLGLSLAWEINDGSISENESMKEAYTLLARKAELLLPVIKQLVAN